MKNRRLVTILGFVGVVIGVIVGRPLINSLLRPASPPSATSPSNVTPTEVAPDPQALAKPHLDSAKSKTENVIEGHLIPVRTFFDDSKNNTRQFAKVALGWGSKWTQVAVRLGISAGILGTGAASGWATLGIGVVVGIIVDQIVSWVWDWWADPTGNLASNLDAKLDEMRTLICDGDSKVEGLRQRFQALATERVKIRETAILDLLSTNQGSK